MSKRFLESALLILSTFLKSAKVQCLKARPHIDLMPCSCQKPEPDYPESDQWGPVLWTILHALAQKAGKAIFPSFNDDEKRQWIQIIELLPKMIPCAMCRAHCEEWIAANPIKIISSLSGDDLNAWVIDWFYRFHENVNARVGKPSFDKALLGPTYNSVSVQGVMKTLKPFIETAIRLTGITLLPWNKWTKHVTFLLSYYG